MSSNAIIKFKTCDIWWELWLLQIKKKNLNFIRSVLNCVVWNHRFFLLNKFYSYKDLILYHNLYIYFKKGRTYANYKEMTQTIYCSKFQCVKIVIEGCWWKLALLIHERRIFKNWMNNSTFNSKISLVNNIANNTAT